MRHIYIVGVGHIGGSLALDLKRIYPHSTLYGIDRSQTHLDQAISLGFIEAKATYNNLKNADLVILAIPVNVSPIELLKILDAISTSTLVMDVGSTKFDICKAVNEHPRRSNFLAAHPIAGTEYSGPQAAIEFLFKNKTMIICEDHKTNPIILKQALHLFKILEMQVSYMPPREHDKHIAYVSHLSHISSFMLGKTVLDKEKNERDIFDMAGSGFESTVRLAKSSPEMWTPIFKQNKGNVIEALQEYIQNLKQFKLLLEEDNLNSIFDQMKSTNRVKHILEGIINKSDTNLSHIEKA